MKNFREKLKTHKKPIAGIAVLFLLAGVFIYEFSDELKTFFPDEDYIKKELSELKKAQNQLQFELNEQYKFQMKRDALIKRSRDFWIASRDGKIETDVHKKIEQAAKLSGLKLSTMGNIRQSKVSEGIYLLEVEISASSKMENFSRFLAEIYMTSPRIYWDKCSLRPDNLNKPQNLMINGNLKLVCLNENVTASFLPEKIK